MPQISPAEFYARPLRVHTFLEDVPLHDVWAVDLPRTRAGVTLEEFHRHAGRDTSIEKFPPAARALFGLRLILGRILRLDNQRQDSGAASIASRLTEEDRARSSVAAGTPYGPFRVVYRFPNELLCELTNHTVRGAALSALAETSDGYRFYFAVYVSSVGWITPVYMALIDPFRRWIVYPAMLKGIHSAWLKAATT